MAESVGNQFASSLTYRMVVDALDSWMVQLAQERSAADAEQLRSTQAAARARVAGRLANKGMARVDTEGLGDCFFIAVIRTLGLELTPDELRHQCCDYLEANAHFFEASFAGGRVGLDRHLALMRKPKTWATAFEVTAVSHMLMRPIHLITDSAQGEDSTIVFEPPPFIAPSAWGPTVYLAHYLEWHFEGTTVVAVQASVSAPLMDGDGPAHASGSSSASSSTGSSSP